MCLIYRLFIGGVLLFLLGCREVPNPEQEALARLFATESINSDSIKALIVLTERGCSGCNVRFSYFALRYINKGDKLIVMKASGVVFDVGPYQQAYNVIFDLNNRFGFPDTTSVYLLGHQQLDSVIRIDAFNLDQSMQWLENRLK